MFSNFDDFITQLELLIIKKEKALLAEINYNQCRTDFDYNHREAAKEVYDNFFDLFMIDAEQAFQKIARLDQQNLQIKHSLKEMIKIAAQEDNG